jgi:transcription antitermination protein nusG
MALRWYVVHAYSNFENKVKQALEERIKREGWSSISARFWCLLKKL